MVVWRKLPDLNPLDSFLWGLLKAQVLSTEIRDHNYLRQCTVHTNAGMDTHAVLITTEECISDLEDRIMEITQSEEQKRKTNFF